MLTVDYDRLGLRAGERVLDLGAGAGRHAFEAYRRGARVVAVDLSRADLADVAATFAVVAAEHGLAEDGAACVNGDATRLPFPDGCFDRVIASEVLEHVADDRAALRELARVLRPGGTLAVTVPAWLPEKVCWALSEQYHAPYVAGGHVRIYAAPELRRRLVAAGFVPAGHHHAHALHTPYWWLRCAVGPQKDIDANPLTKAYHRLLVWDMVEAPLVTRLAERLLQPVIGKSLVLYARKPSAAVVESPVSSASMEDHARVA